MRDFFHRSMDDFRGENQQYRPFIFAYVAIFVVFVASLIFPMLDIDEETRVVISDYQTPIISLGTMVALLLAAYRTRQYSSVYSRVWLFLGIAQLFYFLGDFVWFIYEILLNQSPYPSICDLFYFLYYPFIFIAILQYPVRNLQSTDWLKRFLDLSSILLGGCPFIGITFWGPSFR